MFHTTSTKTTSTGISPLTEPVLMRRSTDADTAQIAVLARLDDKRLPAGPFLVAEVAGTVVAAISLRSGTVVADPFRHTADAVAMLRLRSFQVSGAESQLTERRGWRAARAASAEHTLAAAA